ncbi:MAG: sugar phosphate isomerase/epimerase [Bacteroidetes bacterium]|nr:sugar phosphate isomerase/epimerase [Bacteroidota bacterium]
MNKIGFNTLVWSAEVSDKLFPILDKLKEIGYDGVESFIGSPDEKAYQQFGDYAAALGLETTAVFVLGKDENPVSPSVVVRAKSLDRIKWVIDRAYAMRAKIIAGPFHSAHSIFSREAPQENEYAWSAEILHAAGDYAARAGITLTLEAVNRFECYLCNTMAQLTKLVKLTDHPNVKAMYDTHHANIEEKNIEEAIMAISPFLAHFHISENDRGTPGDGHVQWKETFATLKAIDYKGWLTIEAFSRNDPDFANAIGVWREYSPPWDIAIKGLSFIKQQL